MQRLAQVGALALSLLCIASSNQELSAQPAATTQLEGILGIVWGDPAFGAGGEIRYTLTLSDGRMLPLDTTGQEVYFGKRVVVTGRVVPNQAATNQAAFAGVPAFQVDTIAPSATQTAESAQASPQAAVAIGPKRVIFLLVKFSDDAAVPHPPTFYTDMTNPDVPPAGALFPSTVNGFFKKTSYNQFSWIADVGGMGGVGAPGGWLTLPHDKSYYAPCGFGTACAGAQLKTLADDATTLGRAQGINFTVYDNINFVLSNDLDCCAYGGGYVSTVDNNKFYGATWEPPWGQVVSTYAHEMGHSLGLPHSGWVYYSYDSPWDVMSSVSTINGINCGSYLSKNNSSAQRTLFCGEPADGYIGPHKDYLGWIPAANEVVTDTLSNTTVTLEALALPLSSGIKLLKICIAGSPCTGSTAHFLTVEARVKNLGTTSQFDNGIPGDGIIIHDVQMNRPAISGPCYFNSQSGWAKPIDATPGDYDSVQCQFAPGTALYNAQWAVGQSYSNPYQISVVSRSGSTFVVSVLGSLAAPTTLVSAGTSSSQVALSWTASSGATTYNIKRGTSLGTESIVGTSSTTSFRDTGLSKGTTYFYVVSAVNGSLESANSNEISTTTLTTVRPGAGDVDGDGATDLTVYRSSEGFWYILRSSSNYTSYFTLHWGLSTDTVVPGDYDGDGKTDPAVYRPSTGEWYILTSSSNYTSYIVKRWGLSTDIPIRGDYDGDGKVDLAVYRPSEGFWYILRSSSNYTSYSTLHWGLGTDTVVPGDYDGDGKTDPAVYRPSTGEWYILTSSSNYTSYIVKRWGLSTDIPVRGDYDGDGKVDLAVYRPSEGFWYILTSSSNYTSYFTQHWGLSADIPVTGDYDGDGKADIAVFRPSTGVWYVLMSMTNNTMYMAQRWGLGSDTPVLQR